MGMHSGNDPATSASDSERDSDEVSDDRAGDDAALFSRAGGGAASESAPSSDGPGGPTSALPPLEEPAQGVCRRPAHFYGRGARRLLASLCQSFLTERALTPTELLHSARPLQELDAHPLKGSAMMRAAEIQAQASGNLPEGRRMELETLIDEGMKWARGQLKAVQGPAITPANYGPMAEELLGPRADFDGRFKVLAALSQYLYDARSVSDKVARMLDIVETNPSPRSLALADQLLGELLAIADAMPELLGWPEERRLLAYDIIDLHTPDSAQRAEVPTLARRLKSALDTHHLPDTRDGLVQALYIELNEMDALLPSMAGEKMGDQALLQEMIALAELVQRLRTESGYMGGKRTAELLKRRESYLITEEKLQTALKGKSYYNKILELFRLIDLVLGKHTAHIVEEYLLHFLESRDFSSRLFECFDSPLKKLRSVAEIQSKCEAAPFDPQRRQSLVNRMDEVQYQFLRTTALFAQMRRDNKNPSVDAVTMVLDLCGDGAFTKGRSSDTMRSLVHHHASQSGFLHGFLAQKGHGDFKGLMSRLHKAGIPFREPSSLNILVVEDEDAARSYIEMILTDMGVASVTTAADGRQALEIFADNEDKYDLVVCDWMMPRMSGLEFLKQVRSVSPDKPFLMITALATVEAVEEAITHHVSAYVAKPFEPEQLEEKVLSLTMRSTVPQNDGGGPAA